VYDTLTCVHGMTNPSMVSQVKPEALRYIVSDEELKPILQSVSQTGSHEYYDFLKSLHESGIDVYLTLRFPDQSTSDGPGSVRPRYDSVPLGDDRAQTLLLIEEVIDVLGPFIDGIQINNEPAGGPGQYSIFDLTSQNGEHSPASQWILDASKHVKSYVSDKPAVSHIKVITPAFTGIAAYLDGKNVPKAMLDFSLEKLEIADECCDMVDVHLHVENTYDVDRSLEWIKSQTDLPIIVFEWSQSRVVWDWMGQKHSSGVTNLAYVEQAYKNPVSEDGWIEFLHSSPLDENFIIESWEILQSHQIPVACYAPAMQYGDPLYDVVALFVDLTT
jgi:hypothetical protein